MVDPVVGGDGKGGPSGYTFAGVLVGTVASSDAR
jgi:hypothetical protein